MSSCGSVCQWLVSLLRSSRLFSAHFFLRLNKWSVMRVKSHEMGIGRNVVQHLDDERNILTKFVAISPLPAYIYIYYYIGHYRTTFQLTWQTSCRDANVSLGVWGVVSFGWGYFVSMLDTNGRYTRYRSKLATQNMDSFKLSSGNQWKMFLNHALVHKDPNSFQASDLPLFLVCTFRRCIARTSWHNPQAVHRSSEAACAQWAPWLVMDALLVLPGKPTR